MLLYVAFTVLFISGVSAVPPPTNLTVSCKNVIVTVSWEYSEQQPQTSFRVNLKNYAGDSESITTDHQLDLSRVIWESKERYMGFNYITVTAIQGGNESEPVVSKSFSFNDLKTTDIKCELVFPPVDLNVKGSEATVSFSNPLFFYRELRQTVMQNGPFFSFRVKTDDGDFDKNCDKGCDKTCEDCTLKEETCKRDILFAEEIPKCVKLKGSLFDGNCVGHVLFEETQRICDAEPDDVDVVLLVLLLAVAALIISVVTIFICKTKAWVMKDPKTQPKCLGIDTKNLVLNSGAGSKTDYSAVTLEVEVVKPCETSSVSSQEESDPTRNYERRSGPDFQPTGAFYTDGRPLESSTEELEAEGLIPEGNRSDDDSPQDSVKTEIVSLDSEEEEEEEEAEVEVEVEVEAEALKSAYDRPHAL